MLSLFTNTLSHFSGMLLVSGYKCSPLEDHNHSLRLVRYVIREGDRDCLGKASTDMEMLKCVALKVMDCSWSICLYHYQEIYLYLDTYGLKLEEILKRLMTFIKIS